jgi:hypothetical protein
MRCSSPKFMCCGSSGAANIGALAVGSSCIE